MAIKVFMIQFDKPKNVYYSGETITGKVVVVLDSQKSLNALFVTLRGIAEVSWRETSATDETNQTKHLSSEEVFVDSKIVLLGNTGITTQIPVGNSVFPFTFILPHNLPTSFEGPHGHIRYTITAIMDRPWRFNHDARVPLSIISLVDLNMMPILKVPMTMSNSKQMCCFCCASGPLVMTVHVPFCGVVSGQELPVSVDVENATDVKICQVKCTLIQRATYHARHPEDKSRTEERGMTSLHLGNLDKHSSNIWEKSLVIPPCPTTLQQYCTIINLEYFLKVEAVPSGCHNTMSVYVPITVGAIPLILHTSAPPQQTSTTSNQPSHHHMLPADYHLPPPTYEECMFGAAVVNDDANSRHTYGVKMFAPIYPVFKV